MPIGLTLLLSLSGPMAAAQTTKQFTYTVSSRAVISITNNYGPITIGASGNREVVVKAISLSDAVSFENEQHGNRIELRSRSLTPAAGFAEYNLLVPADSWVTLRSSRGTLHAEGLKGDIVLEAGTASVEVSNINAAHIHVKTLSGPITLTAIRNSHLDVSSVRGDVNLHDVTGSSVEVNSGDGRITYEGDPGPPGEYLLSTHSGDLEVSIPASASAEIRATSLKGASDQAFPDRRGTSARDRGNLLLKPGLVNASRFVLRSFSGNIRLKRP